MRVTPLTPVAYDPHFGRCQVPPKGLKGKSGCTNAIVPLLPEQRLSHLQFARFLSRKEQHVKHWCGDHGEDGCEGQAAHDRDRH